MTDSTDLATILHGSPLTAADSWWTDEESDVVEGFDFIKDKALFALVGVPFRVFSLTFRPGIQQKGCPWRNGFVSAETRVAPAPIIKRQLDRILSRRTDDMIPDPLAIAAPGEMLGINSGSTGIYRQFLEYLEGKELISFPEVLKIGGKEFPLPPKVGEKNECRYDLPVDLLILNDKFIADDTIRVHVDPQGERHTTFSVRLDCLRGLRFSFYKNESAPDGAITWYIA